MAKNKQDEIVQKLFNVVQEKKKEIQKAEKPNWLTNSSFGYTPETSGRKNLRVINNVDELVDILSFLKGKSHFHDEAAKTLGSKSEFTWMGFSLSNWEEDLKTMATKINITKKKSELDILENRLNKLISPELKRQLELEEITKLLEEN